MCAECLGAAGVLDVGELLRPLLLVELEAAPLVPEDPATDDLELGGPAAQGLVLHLVDVLEMVHVVDGDGRPVVLLRQVQEKLEQCLVALVPLHLGQGGASEDLGVHVVQGLFQGLVAQVLEHGAASRDQADPLGCLRGLLCLPGIAIPLLQHHQACFNFFRVLLQVLEDELLLGVGLLAHGMAECHLSSQRCYS